MVAEFRMTRPRARMRAFWNPRQSDLAAIVLARLLRRLLLNWVATNKAVSRRAVSLNIRHRGSRGPRALLAQRSVCIRRRNRGIIGRCSPSAEGYTTCCSSLDGKKRRRLTLARWLERPTLIRRLWLLASIEFVERDSTARHRLSETCRFALSDGIPSSLSNSNARRHDAQAAARNRGSDEPYLAYVIRSIRRCISKLPFYGGKAAWYFRREPFIPRKELSEWLFLYTLYYRRPSVVPRSVYQWLYVKTDDRRRRARLDKIISIKIRYLYTQRK